MPGLRDPEDGGILALAAMTSGAAFGKVPGPADPKFGINHIVM
jgi:hypothetical protein